MARDWTFGQKLGTGFAITVMLAIAIGGVSVYALRSVVASKDHLLTVNLRIMTHAEKLNTANALEVDSLRGYLLGKDPRLQTEMRHERTQFTALLDDLRRLVDTAESRTILDSIAKTAGAIRQDETRLVAMRQTDPTAAAEITAFNQSVIPEREAVVRSIVQFDAREQKILRDTTQASDHSASTAITLVAVFAALAAIIAAVVAFALTRATGRQIGTAVGHVQSSSSELQASANQQATGAREQATAMNEIATTMSELLATSRQIAESAQRVAQIAEDTASAARSGEGTVEQARDSIASIRRQVDLIVGHMLDLGRKSQQIGSVLEIVSELAEQTNILAINATIEASGAGEAGRRFSVVADEIRKLADRVAVSTKEIRGLIDDVRGAVNTTVMTTESGSKAVDTGLREFDEVAASFKEISTLVATTTEAAREIGLSTTQQATAIEQVNIAISNVSQATKEMEVSSSQTLQTASLLTNLSLQLGRMIRRQAAT